MNELQALNDVTALPGNDKAASSIHQAFAAQALYPNGDQTSLNGSAEHPHKPQETKVRPSPLPGEEIQVIVQEWSKTALKDASILARKFSAGDPEKQEELAELGVFRVIEQAHHYRGEAPFKYFAWKCMKRAMLKAVVRGAMRKTVSTDGTGIEDRAKSPWAEAVGNESAEIVRKKLKRLSPMYQTMVQDFYFDQLSLKEMAQKHNVPLGTIKRRLHDARLKLEKALGSQNEQF